jgi:hypothetical protein
MIAQRFRPVGWVAGVALAATALYLVSLQVASERGRLEQIDHKIAATKREIRQLQTEMGTRASLRQLERWNGEVFALSAPQAEQYLSGEAELASLNQDEIGRTPSAPPPPVMVAVPMQVANPIDKTSPSALFAALTAPKVLPKLTVQDRKAQAAFASKPSPRPVPADIALVDRSALAKLASIEGVGRQAKAKSKP